MSILKSLFSSETETSKTEPAAPVTTAFDAANAAIDRAIAERQATEATEATSERRMNGPNRRKAGPDIRPPGSPELRLNPQQSFGRRRNPE